MLQNISDLETERLINQILFMYYADNHSQTEIGQALGLSLAKVNRLLKQARNNGWIEFNIHTPSQHLFDLERLVQRASGVKNAIIVPRFSDNPDAILSSIGKAAADYLLQQIRDGDVVCNSGGRGVAAMVQALETDNLHAVKVVPAMGGVQGRFNTDVNNLAGVLARRLGGSALQLYAPAFTDSEEERNAVINLRHVKEVLDTARNAQIAVVGVGSINPNSSSIWQFASASPGELQTIVDIESGAGEILARIFNNEGEPCALEYSNHIIGISLDDLRSIPLTIGIAALDDKAPAVAAALKGNYLKTIIMDDVTAKEVLSYF
jgi:DNA-binding transcriptional regulator LsrR (DeoR family)